MAKPYITAHVADGSTCSVQPNQTSTPQDNPPSSELPTRSLTKFKADSPGISSPVNSLGRLLGIGSPHGDRKKSYIVRRTDLPEAQERRSSIHDALDQALSPQSPGSRKSFFRRRRGSFGSAAGVMEFLSLDDDEVLSQDEESPRPTKLKKKKKKVNVTHQEGNQILGENQVKTKKKSKKDVDLFSKTAPQFDMALKAAVAPADFQSGYLTVIKRSQSDCFLSRYAKESELPDHPTSSKSMECTSHLLDIESPKKGRRAMVKTATEPSSPFKKSLKLTVIDSNMENVDSTLSSSMSGGQQVSFPPDTEDTRPKSTIISEQSIVQPESSSSLSQTGQKPPKQMYHNPLKEPEKSDKLVLQSSSFEDHEIANSAKRLSHPHETTRMQPHPSVATRANSISEIKICSPVSLKPSRKSRSSPRKSKKIQKESTTGEVSASTTSASIDKSSDSERMQWYQKVPQPDVLDKVTSPESLRSSLSKMRRWSPYKSEAVKSALTSSDLKSLQEELLEDKATLETTNAENDNSETGSVGLNDEEPKPRRALRRRPRPTPDQPSNATVRSRSLPVSRTSRSHSSISHDVTALDVTNRSQSFKDSNLVPQIPGLDRHVRARSRSTVSSRSVGAQIDNRRQRSLSSTADPLPSPCRRRQRSFSPSSLRLIKNRTRLSTKNKTNETSVDKNGSGLTDEKSSVATDTIQAITTTSSLPDHHYEGNPPLSPLRPRRQRPSVVSGRYRRASDPLSPTLSKSSVTLDKTSIDPRPAQERRRSFSRSDTRRSLVDQPSDLSISSRNTSDETISLSTTSRSGSRHAAAGPTSPMPRPRPANKSIPVASNNMSSMLMCSMFDSSFALDDLMDGDITPKISSLTISDCE